MKNNSKLLASGFTLIEIMVTVLIFAIISTVSYRIVSSLVKTNQIVEETQNKWGSLSLVSTNIGRSVNRLIPLIVRDNNGRVLPAMYGRTELSGMYDGQLEMTLSGTIGDEVTGVKPPKRVGYRLYKNTLYLVSWPVLNRSASTTPQIDVLLDDVVTFEPQFLYSDGKWYPTWPPEDSRPEVLPSAIRVDLVMKSSESITREWVLDR
jgi:general secretion pathway protein J